MNRVCIKSEMYTWACERAGGSVDDFTHRFPKLPEWVSGEAQPTLKQLETFAKATYAPVGYFFLPAPPVESLPIPDFRTVGSRPLRRPSPDLLDTLYVCQQRQDWFRDYARANGEDPLSFVGSLKTSSDPARAARVMREALRFDIEERGKARSWADALRQFIEQAEELGVLVMCSGVVQNNTHRQLDPDEFRGFAMADRLAPLIFINGADTKSAQMFTLAHELAHIWLGESAVSDAGPASTPGHRVEVWCNAVAAELLVPMETLTAIFDPKADSTVEIARLAKYFKVSTLVIMRRMHDAGYLDRDEFWSAYNNEIARLQAISKGSGGNFYLTQAARVSRRFAAALVASTLEGQTLFTDAYRMLGFSKHSTFEGLN